MTAHFGIYISGHQNHGFLPQAIMQDPTSGAAVYSTSFVEQLLVVSRS